MSFKVGDLVKLHLGDRWSPRAMAVSKPSRTARLAKWSGEITALYEVWYGVGKGGEKLAHVEPPIIWRPGKEGSGEYDVCGDFGLGTHATPETHNQKLRRGLGHAGARAEPHARAGRANVHYHPCWMVGDGGTPKET